MTQTPLMQACDAFLEILRRENAVMGFLELQGQVKAAIVISSLRAHNGNQCKAAKELQVHRNTLARYVAEIIEAGYPDPIGAAKRKKAQPATRISPVKASAA